MIILTTFSDERMTKAKALCCSSAMKNGVDIVWDQNTDTISPEFRWINREIFCHERGYGYWLWKPYFIYQALNHNSVKEGDILIYADAGVEFINGVQEIVSRMDEDIFFFTNGFSQVEWCKGDVLEGILGDDEIRQFDCDHSDKQVQASVIFFKVNEKTKAFAKEWLMYSQMPGFIDDSPSKTPNYSTFAEHRHDQAILTCLQIKYGYKLHFWPTKYSEHIRHTARPEDNYPTLFNHHRKRDNEW
jgi:hypothetical protein